jgi:hypothetical protein
VEESIAIANSTTLFQRLKSLITVPIHRRALGNPLITLDAVYLTSVFSRWMRPPGLSTVMWFQYPHVLFRNPLRDHRLRPAYRRRANHLRHEFPFHSRRPQVHRYHRQAEDLDLLRSWYGDRARSRFGLILL